MQLLKQNKQEPNCFALSAVMVLRHVLEQEERYMMLTNAHLEGLLEFIGHRGQEILWPECSGPVKLKGIHPQEIIDWYMDFGYTLWLLERYPMSAPRGLEARAKMIWDGDIADKRFWKSLENKAAILVMSTHAVAWDGSKIYDPDDRRFTKSIIDSQVGEAWLIANL